MTFNVEVHMKGKLLLSVGIAGLSVALALVLLASAAPWAARAAGGETFTVDTSADGSDNNPGDCQCQTSGGQCTLRAAIQEANACSGPQTIKFGGPWGITVAGPLPTLTDNGTVIDGSDWWGEGSGLGFPMVWLNGGGGSFHGLVITASDCAVYGLVIYNFGGHGVYLYGGARNNRIGGAGTHQRVVISDNGWNGAMITGTTTTSNTVEACYIGTPPEGTVGDWGNGWHGVSIWYGAGNVISGNLIAGNGWSGVAVDSVNHTVEIRNNRIGLSIDGQPLGNGFYGIHVAHGAMPVIISNTVAFNRRGIHVEGSSSPWIYGNLIYGHNASNGSLDFPRCGAGILCDTSSLIIAGNVITSNVAYTGTDLTGFGGGIAMSECDGSIIGGNQIVSNTANTAGTGRGGGIYLYESDVTIATNTIMSNTAGPGVNSRGGGLALNHSNALITGNTVHGNSVDSGLGGGAWLFYSNVTLDGNTIIANRSIGGDGLEIENCAFFTLTNNIIAQHDHGEGVDIWVTPDFSHGWLVNNTIAQNAPYGYGVRLLENTTLTLTNNMIVSNTTGIYATPGQTNTVIADHTLFYGNTNDTDGSVITNTHAITGRDPLFLDPAAGNYHLRAGSPAVNAGVAVPWLTADIDSDPRPIGAGYDIGADEYVARIWLPLVLRDS